jgi:DNA-binding transcriptional ArsR family regulator
MGVSHSLDKSLIKALAHPLRWRLLEILTERGEASPVELARLLDQPLATVSHHVRVLRDSNCVELTRTEQRRGAIEHYYQPLAPAFFDDEQWTATPAVFRRALAGQVFRRIIDEAAAAGEAGAFDLSTAHMDRMLVELDERGRRELSDLLNETLRRAQDIQERSDTRTRDDGDARLSVVAVLHFDLPDTLASGEDARAKRGRSPRLPDGRR